MVAPVPHDLRGDVEYSQSPVQVAHSNERQAEKRWQLTEDRRIMSAAFFCL